MARIKCRASIGHLGLTLPAGIPELPHSARGEIGINRHFEVIRRVLNWAILKGYYEQENPFLRHSKRVVKFAAQKARTRRLQLGEEQRLLDAAAPHLQAFVIAALETGCRKGELLSLKWRDVLANEQGEARTLSLRAENTKTDTANDTREPETSCGAGDAPHGPGWPDARNRRVCVWQ